MLTKESIMPSSLNATTTLAQNMRNTLQTTDSMMILNFNLYSICVHTSSWLCPLWDLIHWSSTYNLIYHLLMLWNIECAMPYLDSLLISHFCHIQITHSFFSRGVCVKGFYLLLYSIALRTLLLSSLNICIWYREVNRKMFYLLLDSIAFWTGLLSPLDCTCDFNTIDREANWNLLLIPSIITTCIQ